jgi:tetratricopeptide (TPR) repeat protein
MMMHPSLETALDLIDEENYAGALEVLDELLRDQPEHSQALFESAMALLELDRIDAAIGRFECVAKIEADYPGNREWLARSYNELGRHREAAECLLPALRTPTSTGASPGSWDQCARYFLAAGDKGRACELLEEYVAEHEARVTTYAVHRTGPLRSLAMLLLERGEEERALELARRAYVDEHQVPADIATWIRVAARAGAISEARNAWQAFRETSYWDRYQEFDAQVRLHDELASLTREPT